MASQAGEKEVIVIPEEDPDDWPDVGPQNPEEADSYVEKINNIFETMVENVSHDKKDTLPSAMRSLKKLMSRHWPSVGDTNPDVVIQAVGDPVCIYLRQHLSLECLQMLDPMEEVPEG